MQDGARLQNLSGGSEHVYALAFSPDGDWLASGSRERGTLMTLWESIAGERLSGRRGRTLRLWNVRSRELQQAIAEHAGDVHGVDFSRDGRWLATSGDDRTVKLWQVEPPVPPYPLTGATARTPHPK